VAPFLASAAVLQKRQSTDLIGYAAEGGTTGGGGVNITRVSTLSALTEAVYGDAKKTVILTASLSGNAVVNIGANTTVLGANGSIMLYGIGLRVLNTRNVIIRNLIIQKVLATAGDAIGIQNSSNVWVDHVDLSSDRSHGKDYYDGLLDITHGCTNITVSWSKFSDHFKASLVGHDDDNGAEDKKITVTFHHNYWTNINSRMPSLRFGRGHMFNNYYENSGNGIEPRVGAQVQIENSVFSNVTNPVFTDQGYACLVGNDLGGATDAAPQGTCFKPPYNYQLDATSDVKSIVTKGAGADLSFY